MWLIVFPLQVVSLRNCISNDKHMNVYNWLSEAELPPFSTCIYNSQESMSTMAKDNAPCWSIWRFLYAGGPISRCALSTWQTGNIQCSREVWFYVLNRSQILVRWYTWIYSKTRAAVSALHGGRGAGAPYWKPDPPGAALPVHVMVW